jgi:hypothetical protein
MAAVGAASAGNITYDLINYPAFQNGSTLGGSITTNGQIGDLSFSDVLAWQVIVTPPGGVAFKFDSTQPGSSVPQFQGVTADLQFIKLSATPDFDLFGNEAFFAGPTSRGALFYERASLLIPVERYEATAPQLVWDSNPGPTDLGGDPWIIATVPTTVSAVPEPSTLVMSLIPICGCAAICIRRRLMPRGFTANSLEAGIVDNRFAADNGPASVPEPATFLQFAVGLTGLLTASGWRRFRSRVVTLKKE